MRLAVRNCVHFEEDGLHFDTNQRSRKVFIRYEMIIILPSPRKCVGCDLVTGIVFLSSANVCHDAAPFSFETRSRLKKLRARASVEPKVCQRHDTTQHNTTESKSPPPKTLYSQRNLYRNSRRDTSSGRLTLVVSYLLLWYFHFLACFFHSSFGVPSFRRDTVRRETAVSSSRSSCLCLALSIFFRARVTTMIWT